MSVQSNTCWPSTRPVTSAPVTWIARWCHAVASNPVSEPLAMVEPSRWNCQLPPELSRSAYGVPLSWLELAPPVDRAPIAA